MSQTNKPRVLLDVDGVLADFFGKAIEVINEVSGNSFTKQDITDYDMFACLNISEEQELECRKIFESRGFALDLEIYPDAQEAVEQLKEHSDLYFLTSPILSETWVHDRRMWLEKHFKVSHERIIFTASKHVVKGDYLIDDSLDNIKKWIEHNDGIGVLWRQSYNLRCNTGFHHHIDDWNFLLKKIKKI